MKGKWRIIKMPDYTSDYPDMVEPAYIRFDGKGSGEFAFGCVTGHIHGAGDGNAIEFSWDGNDEMDEACGEGWAELCLTARSKVKSASTAAMKPTSPHALGRLLQQPAKAEVMSSPTAVTSMAKRFWHARKRESRSCCPSQ